MSGRVPVATQFNEPVSFIYGFYTPSMGSQSIGSSSFEGAGIDDGLQSSISFFSRKARI
jgi:hypothetical protein